MEITVKYLKKENSHALKFTSNWMVFVKDDPDNVITYNEQTFVAELDSLLITEGNGKELYIEFLNDDYLKAKEVIEIVMQHLEKIYDDTEIINNFRNEREEKFTIYSEK